MSSAIGWLQDAVVRLRAFAYGPAARPSALRPRVGLALGGGFARGIAHLGVLKVLEENRVPIDCVAGTSVGALIAAAYAGGTPLAEMERRASTTRFRDFGRWTLSWLGLASNDRIEDYLHRVCAAGRFEELDIPLAIAATDLNTGEPLYFTEGELGAPLRASCAYPGLFLPVEYGGRVLVDGFLAAPVPVEGARRLGAEVVIAVYLESSPLEERPKNVVDVIGRSFSILQRHVHPNWREEAEVVIEPDVKGFLWDDFAQAPQLIAAGEAAAQAALPRILRTVSPPLGETLSAQRAYR